MAAPFVATDLFCGGANLSQGLGESIQEIGIEEWELHAVNHWDVAIKTHQANFPFAKHYCASVEELNPRKVVPGGRVNIMVASPECTHHSIARGGRPIHDQKRTPAWAILRWVQELYVDSLVIENVKEFKNWGPIGANGRPLESKKGQTYRAFIAALRSLGYRVEDRILNAADYGDPTVRKRLFILARRANRKITWPLPTHSETPGKDLFGHKTKPWVPAKKIIDLTDLGRSIFDPTRKPLATSTLKRIAYGIEKFAGEAAKPFIVVLRQHMDGRSLDEPIPTLTASGQHVGLCVPKEVILKDGDIEIFKPFLVPNFGERKAGRDSKKDQKPRTGSIDNPTPAVTSHGAGSVVTPILIRYNGGQAGVDRVHSTDVPIPNLDTSNRYAIVVPFITTAGGPEGQGRNPKSIDEPVGTILSENHKGIVYPIIIPVNHGGLDMRAYDLRKQPFPGITTVDAWAKIKPWLMKYYGTLQDPKSVDYPVETLTAKDRFALVQPKRSKKKIMGYYLLDIFFRMLKPKELAAAMSFPKNHRFHGTREEVVKQIGNAVPRRIGRALCSSLLRADFTKPPRRRRRGTG